MNPNNSLEAFHCKKGVEEVDDEDVMEALKSRSRGNNLEAVARLGGHIFN